MAGLATRLVLDERGMIGQAGGKVQAAKALSAAVRKERTSGALIKAAGVEDGGAQRSGRRDAAARYRHAAGE